MKEWLVLLGVCLLSITAYVASGPYRTVRAIREAVQAQDAAALSKQVDFPLLRASLKAQLSDRLVRKAGPGLQSSVFAAFGLRTAGCEHADTGVVARNRQSFRIGIPIHGHDA
jgi:hypothetical protein